MTNNEANAATICSARKFHQNNEAGNFSFSLSLYLVYPPSSPIDRSMLHRLCQIIIEHNKNISAHSKLTYIIAVAETL